jgi:hypothetical protein
MNQVASAFSLFTNATTGERVPAVWLQHPLRCAQMQQTAASSKIAQNFAYFPLEDKQNSSRGFLEESFCGIENVHLG